MATPPITAPILQPLKNEKKRAQLSLITYSFLFTAIFISCAALVDNKWWSKDSMPSFYWQIQLGVGVAAFVVVVVPIVLRATNVIELDDEHSVSQPRTGSASAALKPPEAWAKLYVAMNAVLWIITIGQFVIHAALVESSGGMEASPYASVLITFIVLGPTLMRGDYSILVLLAVSVVVVALLYKQPDLLNFDNMPSQVHGSVSSAAEASDSKTDLHMTVTLGTLAISLLAAFRFRKRNPRIGSASTEEAPSTGEAAEEPGDGDLASN